MNFATQTSPEKMHKSPIVGLHKLHVWNTQTSHCRDTNRTSSLFGLFFGLSGESLEASPLRCRAATHCRLSVESSWKGVPPFQTIPPIQKGLAYRCQLACPKPVATYHFQTRGNAQWKRVLVFEGPVPRMKRMQPPWEVT